MNYDSLLSAVAAELNAAELVDVTAVVDYAPEMLLDELTAPKLLVSPAYGEQVPLTEEPVARNVSKATAQVAVALIAKPAKPERLLEELPGLLEQLRALREGLRQRKLTALPTAKWRRNDLIAAPSPGHLRDRRVFFGLFHAVYEVTE